MLGKHLSCTPSAVVSSYFLLPIDLTYVYKVNFWKSYLQLKVNFSHFFFSRGTSKNPLLSHAESKKWLSPLLRCLPILRFGEPVCYHLAVNVVLISPGKSWCLNTTFSSFLLVGCPLWHYYQLSGLRNPGKAICSRGICGMSDCSRDSPWGWKF